MRLTTKGRYAVTAMLDLALHANAGPTSLADISQRQDISLSYLEQLFAKLRRSQLVVSVRGALGGYQLAKSPPELTAGQVLRALEGDLEIRFHDDEPLGAHRQQLPRYGTRHLWQALTERVAELVAAYRRNLDAGSGQAARALVGQEFTRGHFARAV